MASSTTICEAKKLARLCSLSLPAPFDWASKRPPMTMSLYRLNPGALTASTKADRSLTSPAAASRPLARTWATVASATPTATTRTPPSCRATRSTGSKESQLPPATHTLPARRVSSAAASSAFARETYASSAAWVPSSWTAAELATTMPRLPAPSESWRSSLASSSESDAVSWPPMTTAGNFVSSPTTRRSPRLEKGCIWGGFTILIS
mmetsp:Transcript_1280/g.2726  ORF Transcript_1280/g.2726 Transcript_1280/m.2726 type:complete len:208 (-) Transcript_1280:345-968(-)